MPGKSYLCRRGQWYHFRLHVPKHLIGQWNDTSLRVSLQTQSLQTALYVAKLLYPYACNLIRHVKGVKVDRAYIMELIKTRIQEILAVHDEGVVENARTSPRSNPGELLWTYDQTITHLQQCLAVNDTKTLATYFAPQMEIVSEDENDAPQIKGIDVPPTDDNYLWAIRTYAKGMIEAFKISKQRLQGNYDNGYDSPILPRMTEGFNAQGMAEAVVQKISIDDTVDSMVQPKTVFKEAHAEAFVPGMNIETLRTVIVEMVAPLLPPKPEPLPPAPLKPLIDKLCDEQLNAHRWTEHYIQEAQAYLGVMVEYFGPDTDVRTITRDQMLELRDKVLKCLPKNRNIRPDLKNLTLRQQLEVPGTEKIGIVLVNKYLDLFGRFFRWCLDNKTITDAPSRNLMLKNPEAAQDQRKPFTKAELIKIITRLNPNRYPPDTYFGTLERERFWIILLAIFQGMRENEICQLFIKDIVQVDGVPCINITADNTTAQRTKNAPSRRVIPIHPALLKLGLLEFANRNRCFCNEDQPSDNRNQLFRTMVYTPRRGYVRTLQVFFSKFKREHITDDRKKTFHSFRHNFDTAMMNLGVTQFIVECLDGHKRQGETAGRYAKPQVGAMLNALSKLDHGFNIFEILGATPLSDEEINRQKEQLPVFEN